MIRSQRRLHALEGVNVGVYQDVHHAGGWEQGLVVVREVLAESSEKMIDLVLFPELFLTGYTIGRELLMANATNIDGRIMIELKETTKKYGVGIAIGYPELAGKDILYNSLCVIDAAGNIVLNYRKTHLYDPTLEYEKVIFTPGDAFPVGEIYFPRLQLSTKIGALICFDVEFPEPCRILALQGASIVLVSTADTENVMHTPKKTLPCRAAENNVFLMYANYTGPCNCFHEAATFHGQSGIFAPDGSTLKHFDYDSCSSTISRGLLCTQLNSEEFVEHKMKNDYLMERRPEIYSNWLCRK